MCNCILETIFSLHHNRCTNQNRKKPAFSSPRINLPSALTTSKSIPESNPGAKIVTKNKEIKKSTKIKPLDAKQEEKAEVEIDEDYSDFDIEIECQCGKILTKGWLCDKCRTNCSICSRALSINPEEYCTRCFTYCEQHGLIEKSKKAILQSNVKCMKCDDSLHILT